MSLMGMAIRRQECTMKKVNFMTIMQFKARDKCHTHFGVSRTERPLRAVVSERSIWSGKGMSPMGVRLINALLGASTSRDILQKERRLEL